jgi:ATP-dependent RNA helicase DDX21
MGAPHYAAEAAFAKFRISSATVQKLLQRGVTHLFPIQEASFDPIYDGKDVLGRARTGTGKTLSFALPIVERLQEKPSGSKRAPRALVLAPTRELAKQVRANHV